MFAKETLLWQENSKKRPSGQVLDHQEVRHAPKDHSQRKDRRQKRSQTTFIGPRRCYFTQRAGEATIRIVRLHATLSVWHYKKKKKKILISSDMLGKRSVPVIEMTRATLLLVAADCLICNWFTEQSQSRS